MDWQSIGELFAMGAAIVAALTAIMKIMLKDLHKDLVDLKEGQKRLEIRMDRTETRMDKTDVRLDQLYQTCIEMLGTRHKG